MPGTGSIFWSTDKSFIEVKSVQKLAPIHLAQVLTYLKLADLHIGLLLNFNVVHLRYGGSGCC